MTVLIGNSFIFRAFLSLKESPVASVDGVRDALPSCVPQACVLHFPLGLTHAAAVYSLQFGIKTTTPTCSPSINPYVYSPNKNDD
eukprot:5539227-Amphidinium_carterae.1